MKLRAPAYPLVTVDPYFSLWSMADTLNGDIVRHWTCKPNTMNGLVVIDGVQKQFLGAKEGAVKIPQVSVDFNAMTTTYVFADDAIRLTVRFTAPLFPDNLKLMTRPVDYMAVTYTAIDGKAHDVKLMIAATEELVMNAKGDDTVTVEQLTIGDIACGKMGKTDQKILNRSGDDLRIEWGYFYMGVKGGTFMDKDCPHCGMHVMKVTKPLTADETALVLLAYDDIYSIEYFGDRLKSVWNSDGTTIEQAIAQAAEDYPTLIEKCDAFSDKLYLDAAKAGGCKYAEMVSLAFRQAIASHKCVYDKEGNLLFISKECFSNGCAATVDVSYPSIPVFLLYNPELVKGMMRPIYRFASSDAWKFDFAPHDCGQYPLVNGQVYANCVKENQMPVEECGNMLVMEASVAVAEKDASFAKEHWDILTQWVQYLLKYGNDPENQLCTDDFAGHLAHNCNLAIKAIVGVAGYAILNRMLGDEAAYDDYMAKAKAMALSWCERASNGDGSYRLAFDRPGTFSLKYNAVWDKLFGTNLFPAEVLNSELFSNFKHINAYGMPLDNRSDYTKTDWLLWTATMLNDDDDFERFIAPVWQSYHHTENRVPMTDWYYTTTARQQCFQNRTVIGGLFIKLLSATGKMKI